MHLRPALVPLLLLALGLTAGCGGEPAALDTEDLESDAHALTASDCTDEAIGRKVTFCHATSSATNPYTVVTVSVNACTNAHVNHAGDVLPDVNGACCPIEEQDCAGVCGGSAVEDCMGTCDGTAVEDCAGTCEGTAVEDCAGTCEGTAVEDCAGTCDGLAEEVDVVHFTTNTGVYRWTSGAPAAPPYPISTFPSYALAVSSLGEVFVGTGGVEASADIATSGVYALDGAGQATLVSATPAEDLQFSPDGDLYAGNSAGIFFIDETTGLASQLSSDPTSQFVFEDASTVVTTNGIAYQSVFGRGTHRLDLSGGPTALVNADGGEDIKMDGGTLRVCGQGGIFDLLPSGAFSNILRGPVFNFGEGRFGDLYIGNATSYGPFSWPQGFYAPSVSTTDDINALVVTEACE